MNGNDINNMAQRYKDEMMRLYKKNNADSAMHPEHEHSTHQTVTVPQTPPQTVRDISGTPVPGVPDASFYNARPDRPQQTTPVDIPVNCTCRFPSAESIIDSIAGTPMTLPITPEDNPPPVAETPQTPIQPRMYDMPMNGMNNANQIMGAENNPAVSRNIIPQGIMISTSLNGGTMSASDTEDNDSEILPDYPLPADIPAESSETVPSTANFSPSLSWISLTGDDSWGFLQFNVFTADGAVPVQGALVTVRKRLPGGNGLVRILLTNRSGRTPTIALPAPAQTYSQYPGSSVRPYSEYSIVVRANGYYAIRDIRIPIFAGIKTIQPIDLVPLPYNNRPQPRNGSDVG